MVRILMILLVVCAAVAYKWPGFQKKEAVAAVRPQQPEPEPGADLVDQLNRQLPRSVIPGVMEMRHIDLDGHVARFHMYALGRTEIREQRFFDESKGQLREFYCSKLRRFVNAGISVEFVAHSPPTFEDIRTRTIQIRSDPTDCSPSLPGKT